MSVWLYADDGFWHNFPNPEVDPVPDGEAVFDDEPTEEQLLEAFPNRAARVLVNSRAAAAVVLAADCESVISNGYASSALGTAHAYPSQSNDQSNLHTGLLSVPADPTGWTWKLWCSAPNEESVIVWTYAEHDADQLKQAIIDYGISLQSIQSHWADVMAALNAATTLEEVAAVVW